MFCTHTVPDFLASVMADDFEGMVEVPVSSVLEAPNKVLDQWCALAGVRLRAAHESQVPTSASSRKEEPKRTSGHISALITVDR